MGSYTLLVFTPLPTSLIASPIGMQMMICTGSGKIGPRNILLDFKSSAFIEHQPFGLSSMRNDARLVLNLHGHSQAVTRLSALPPMLSCRLWFRKGLPSPEANITCWPGL
jgi:hypothetical protein